MTCMEVWGSFAGIGESFAWWGRESPSAAPPPRKRSSVTGCLPLHTTSRKTCMVYQVVATTSVIVRNRMFLRTCTFCTTSKQLGSLRYDHERCVGEDTGVPRYVNLVEAQRGKENRSREKRLVILAYTLRSAGGVEEESPLLVSTVPRLVLVAGVKHLGAPMMSTY